jgi:Bacteriophage Sf6, terminase small subunit-like
VQRDASENSRFFEIARVLVRLDHVAGVIMPERVLVLIDYIRPDILGGPQARCKSRPTKYNEETIERLLEGLSDGLSIKSACVCAGIGVSTLAEWREKYPALEERMDEAREVARQKMLKRIKRAADDDWRAAAEWLRLTFPADYRRPASNTAVEVNTAVQTGIVCDEATRMRLIKLREELQASRPETLPGREQPEPVEQPREAEVTDSNGTPTPTPEREFDLYRWWVNAEKAEPEPGPEYEI